MILYHLTTKNNLDSILKNGLIPQIGKNSSFVGEEDPYIYLSNLDDIHIWSIIFKDYDICITVDVDEQEVEEYKYEIYSEFLYKQIIPKTKIISYEEYKYKRTKKVNKFYLNTLYKISSLSKRVIVYFENSEDFSDIIRMIRIILNMNIQFKDLYTQEELSKLFIKEGEYGESTIFDTDTRFGIKIYEELLIIHNDVTDSLHHYIVEQFYGCLSLDTGKWE
jgi:hypothetical protein